MRGYNYAGYVQQRCKHCQERKRPNEQCCIACTYCHQYHSKTQMPNLICPKMKQHVSSFHQKDQFTCRVCEGQGILEKEITTTFYQTEEKYFKRLEQYAAERLREGALDENRPKPERKVIKTSVSREPHQCQECRGSGVIRKIVSCCLEGCSRCQFERCFINPTWSNYFCEPISIISQRRQPCISCNSIIEIRSEYCPMGCGHNYHNVCYIRDVYLADSECIECGYRPFPLNEEDSSVRMTHSLGNSEIDLKISDISYIGKPRGVVKGPQIDISLKREYPRSINTQLNHLQRFEELMRELDIQQANNQPEFTSQQNSQVEDGLSRDETDLSV